MNLERMTPTLGEVWDSAPTWVRFVVTVAALTVISFVLGFLGTCALVLFVGGAG